MEKAPLDGSVTGSTRDPQSPWRVSPASVGAVDPPPLAPQSPWRTIWLSPRLTVRGLIERDTGANWLAAFLCAVGLGLRVNVLNGPATGAHLPLRARLIRVVFMSGLVGYVVAVGPAVIRRFAKNANGLGTARMNRVALTWSLVPAAASAILWVPLWLSTGGAGYDHTISGIAVGGPADVLYYLITTAMVWSAVLAVNAVAEAERISRWEAFGCLTAVGVTIFVFAIALVTALAG